MGEFHISSLKCFSSIASSSCIKWDPATFPVDGGEWLSIGQWYRWSLDGFIFQLESQEDGLPMIPYLWFEDCLITNWPNSRTFVKLYPLGVNSKFQYLNDFMDLLILFTFIPWNFVVLTFFCLPVAILQWIPTNVSVPLLNLVDKIFQLKWRGWLRFVILCIFTICFF